MRKTSIPCYVKNGGVHDVVNIPLGAWTRVRLKHLCRELLKSQSTLQTFCAAKATSHNMALIKGLLEILSLNLKPKSNREAAVVLTSANEKNLKPTQRMKGSDEETTNLVQFSISCGLIALLYLLAAHLEYLEALSY